MAYLSNSLFTSIVVAVILVVYTAEAFTPSQRTILVPRISSSIVVSSNTVLKASEGSDDEVGLPPLPSQKGAVVKKKEPITAVEEESAAPETEREVSTTSKVVVDEQEGTSYPIDLPSPVLLGASMVLAISSIGKMKMIYIPEMLF
ncbi:hypothetical protein N9140_00960 [bacterium]|nr:hypothetical protein [bacterium]